MKRYTHYIDGCDVAPQSASWFDTANPFTGQAWAQVAQGNAQDVDRAVQAAHAAFTIGPWSQLTATARGALMRRVADLIARDAN
ncbi:MAG: aldehyde dehydrogenase family protein, partial [Caldimonas sp.]